MQIFVGIPTALEIFTQTYGLALFVHDLFTSPLSLQPITIYPNVAIARIKTQKLAQPYSDCLDLNDQTRSTLTDTITKKGITYTQKDCIIQCYQLLVITKCSCYDLKFVSYFDSATPPCATTNCSSLVYEQFLEAEFLKSTCMPWCPLECDSTSFDTFISMNGYPTTNYESRLIINNSQIQELFPNKEFSEPLRYQIVAVNVFLNSLSYTKIVESPAMDVITLISNVGGSIGLMLGLCVITFVEIIEFLIKVFFICWRHRMALRKNKNGDGAIGDFLNLKFNIWTKF
jgi:hypothetical protein